MEKYTIYCTKEQTKKAYELGAPIEIEEDNEEDKFCIVAINPTAEQMICWLEEQEIFIHIDYDFHNVEKPYKCEMCLFNGMTCHAGWFINHKEAVLRAIDKALGYLSDKKK